MRVMLREPESVCCKHERVEAEQQKIVYKTRLAYGVRKEAYVRVRGSTGPRTGDGSRCLSIGHCSDKSSRSSGRHCTRRQEQFASSGQSSSRSDGIPAAVKQPLRQDPCRGR